MALDTEVEKIIKQLSEFKHEIKRMDLKVHEFISDREKHRHPYPEGLVEKIRKFENSTHVPSYLTITFHFGVETAFQGIYGYNFALCT